MNSILKNILKTILTLNLIWFIGYFVFGEHISLEFSNYEFAKLFPKLITFTAGASIYLLVLLTIKKENGFSIKNILKFIVGILLAFAPFILFKYYSSVANCQDWEVRKKNVSTLFISKTSTKESIKTIDIYCQELNKLETKNFKVTELTSLFNIVTEIDTAKLEKKDWKKINNH